MEAARSPASNDAFVASAFSLSNLTGAPPDAPARALQNERLVRVVRAFQAVFPSTKVDALRVAVAPGRVNLIGEHIDYEGYSVFPMAIAQSMAIAIASSSTTTPGYITLQIANTDPAYSTASITLASCDATGDALFRLLTASLNASTAWVRYVLCGYMAVVEWLPTLASASLAVDLLVDGTIPPACGLSSSSALVVASALTLVSYFSNASSSANANLPTRMQLAQYCRDAEQFVGTVGGGMDQAVSCLANGNAALFVTFSPTFSVESVAFSSAFHSGKALFLVVNSGVQAHKAQDAATRFNKRVIECALATKLLGKRLSVMGWKKMTTLRELHDALALSRGQELMLEELLQCVDTIRDQEEFTIEDLERELSLSPTAPLHSLFVGSRLEKAAQHMLTGSPLQTFRLWQRARHVWTEADRVVQFRALLSAADTEDTENQRLKALGALMVASHGSCRDDYECSCPELDLIVETAQRVGAYGARLTGAGWGGFAVVLVAANSVASLRQALEAAVFKGKAPHGSMFESSACEGAQLFKIYN